MAHYIVHYASSTGKLGQKVIDAVSERAAFARIEGSGLTPIQVQSAGADEQKPSKISRRVRNTKAGRSLRRAILDFTHQLTAVSESGIPIIAGLKAVGEQATHPRLREAIGRMVTRIEGGRTLADALDAEPEIFSELYAKTLAAGEVAGKVSDVLASLARYQEQENETRSQIRSAMTYPLLVVISLVLATTVMLILVIPQFAALFKDFQAELPLPTRILMITSNALTQHYLLVLSGIFLFVYAMKVILSYRSVRSWLDYRILKLPVFGNLLVGVYMVRMIELLGMLMRAALPIIQALRVTADSMTNEAIRQDIHRIRRAVEGGRSLTEAFSETEWLTPLVKRMLAIGEQAGRTDQIFDYLRKFYAQQTKRSIKLLSTLVEPIMVTGLAAVVLFFALAIFLPMWRLLKIVGTA